MPVKITVGVCKSMEAFLMSMQNCSPSLEVYSPYSMALLDISDENEIWSGISFTLFTYCPFLSQILTCVVISLAAMEEHA